MIIIKFHTLNYGFFEKTGTRITVKHLDKSFFEMQLFKAENASIWETIKKDMDEKVKESIAFSSVLDADKVVDELKDDEASEDTK